MKKSIIYGLLLALLLPVSSFAAKVSGLYEAEIQVYSQKSSERELAMVSALAEVFAKVSGKKDAASTGKMPDALKNPNRFLQQYRYRALPDEDLQRELAVAKPGDKPQLLVFRFDKAAVNKALSDNGLPVWGATRPTALVWLAVEDEGRRYMVGSTSKEPLRQELLKEARRRGMAVLLPLMDLQDQMALSFSDVWGGFREAIEKASSRYNTEAVLIGRLYRPNGGDWQGQWTLLEGGFLKTWRGAGILPEELLDDGVAGAIEDLASRYAPAAGQKEGLLPVTVTDVHTLDDYARVSHYLKSLQQVSSVNPSRVEADRVTFELDIHGSAASFSQTVALGNVLTPFKPLPDEDKKPQVTWATGYKQVYQLLP
jgi:hypothetical protein